jgi:hypothetical protein
MTTGLRYASILGALLLSVLFSLHSRAGTFPSRDPQVVVPLLQAWHEHDGYRRLTQVLGRPDGDVGSGLYIWTFRLTDGTTVYASAGQLNRMMGISRSAPGGLKQTLYTPMAHDLDHPVPASAPF